MIWTIIGSLCCVVLLVTGIIQSPTRKARRHVAGRPRLTDREFSERFFQPAERKVAIRVRQILAPYLPVTAAQIDPADELVGDLGLATRDGLDGVAFFRDLEDEFRCRFTGPDMEQVRTFRDVVDAVIRKTASPVAQEPVASPGSQPLT